MIYLDLTAKGSKLCVIMLLNFKGCIKNLKNYGCNCNGAAKKYLSGPYESLTCFLLS